MNSSIDNTKLKYPEYRVSRSKKVRMIKILVSSIITFLFFAFSKFSGLGLASDTRIDLCFISTMLFLPSMLFLIVIVSTNLQSRRIVVNKDGIYRISGKKRIFIPWYKIISVKYLMVYRKESLEIVFKEKNRIWERHSIKSYDWELPFYYPVELWDGHHFRLRENKVLEECLWHYCNLYKIKYQFKLDYTKRVRYR